MATLGRSMRLFGLPYQFPAAVDPRSQAVSTIVGRSYAERIIMDAPVITFIPGRPAFVGLSTNKKSKFKQDVLLASAQEDGGYFKALLKKNTYSKAFRYYDFEQAYTEYMKYVNILCRTCAVFLDIDVNIDGTNPRSYDWRDWKWTTNKYLKGNAVQNALKVGTDKLKTSLLTKVTTVSGKIKDLFLDTSTTAKQSSKNKKKFLYQTTTSNPTNENAISLEDMLSNYSYVQFYVDVNSGAQESFQNTTTQSKMKSMFDGGSDMLKELAFITNSGGIDTTGFNDFAEASMTAIADQIGSFGSISGALSRILNLSSNVVKGENVIMPDIYQSSSYDKSYTVTVHLKTPYGTRYGFFFDICVPLMHLLALAIPKQTSGNTYGSPFLVKCFQEGAFSCNMGIVTSLSVNKGEFWSADGYPTEVDVSMSITDLYSDLTMSPQSNPYLFINNHSLIDYLGVTCGLSMNGPNLQKRSQMIINSVKNGFADTPSSIMSALTDHLHQNLISFTGLRGI